MEVKLLHKCKPSYRFKKFCCCFSRPAIPTEKFCKISELLDSDPGLTCGRSMVPVMSVRSSGDFTDVSEVSKCSDSSEVSDISDFSNVNNSSDISDVNNISAVIDFSDIIDFTDVMAVINVNKFIKIIEFTE